MGKSKANIIKIKKRFSIILMAAMLVGNMQTVALADTVEAGNSETITAEPTTQVVDGFKLYIEDGVVTSGEYVSGDGKLNFGNVKGTKIIQIDNNAFSGCDALTYVKIPSTVKKVSKGAFSDCINLVTVDMPEKLERIGDGAFSGCVSLENIKIPYITQILKNGLYGVINKRTFSGCTSLKKVLIPKVHLIESNAFAGCTGITEISLYASVKQIDEDAFADCDNLKTVRYEGTEAQWQSVTGHEQLDAIPGINIIYKSKLEGSATDEVAGYWHLADGVLSYTAQEEGYILFSSINKSDVKKVVITSGPTRHEEYKLNGFENLEEVIYEAPITNKDMLLINPSMYKDCPKLKKVTIGKVRKGEGVELGEKAFYNCPSLTDVTLGQGVWQMGRNTFGDCIGLTSFKFPDDIHDVRGDTFSGCINLTSISLASSNSFMKVDHNTLYEYFDPYNNKDWGGVTRPGAYITPCLVFVPEGIVRQNEGNYTVTKGIKDIQFWTFAGNKSLKHLTLASTVKSIQLEAFLHCDNIESVTLPKSLERIGQDAFSPVEPEDFDPYDEETGTNSLVNVNKNLKDIYYQGSEEEWKQIELATYILDEGSINKMTIVGRDSNGKIKSDYKKEYLYDHLEKAGIPGNVKIHFNCNLTDTPYVLGKSNEETPDVIYQETKLGADDDDCIVEKQGKIWEIQYISSNEIRKLTIAKGNKVKIPDFAALVSGDDLKRVVVNKKGYIIAKKDTEKEYVSVVYENTAGKQITLKIGVIMPVLDVLSYVADAPGWSDNAAGVSDNAITGIKKLSAFASLSQGHNVNVVLVAPNNYSINMNKVVNKSGAEYSLKREADGMIHLRAKVTQKGVVKIPVSINGKTFRLKLVIKK